jgi:hypothetical protein
MIGGWRKLHNEELHDLHFSPNTIRMTKSRSMIWAGHVVCMGVERIACRILVGKPTAKRPLGQPRRKWDDNIRTNLRVTVWSGMGWINLPRDRESGGLLLTR